MTKREIIKSEVRNLVYKYCRFAEGFNVKTGKDVKIPHFKDVNPDQLVDELVKKIEERVIIEAKELSKLSKSKESDSIEKFLSGFGKKS